MHSEIVIPLGRRLFAPFASLPSFYSTLRPRQSLSWSPRKHNILPPSSNLHQFFKYPSLVNRHGFRNMGRYGTGSPSQKFSGVTANSSPYWGFAVVGVAVGTSLACYFLNPISSLLESPYLFGHMKLSFTDASTPTSSASDLHFHPSTRDERGATAGPFMESSTGAGTGTVSASTATTSYNKPDEENLEKKRSYPNNLHFNDNFAPEGNKEKNSDNSQINNPSGVAGSGSGSRGHHHESLIPGHPMEMKSRFLDSGSSLFQDFSPLDGICQHICGFHFYADQPDRQVEAHHYCMHLNEDVRQCVLFDSNQKGARLIGVEYIISRELFDALPEEEKKYWHSHQYEVKGGLIHMPSRTGVPRMVIRPAEKKEMEKLIDTYGKTIHLWQIDKGHELPFGPPQLMMSFTRPGMIDQNLIESRDERFGVKQSDLVQEREYMGEQDFLKNGHKAKGCDTWEKGQVYQFEVASKNKSKAGSLSSLVK